MPRGIIGRGECRATVECAKPQHARGWCSTHHKRWLKHGDPLWEPSPKSFSNDAGVMGKICPRCSTWKPITEYNKDSSLPSGLACWCRECAHLKVRTFNENNPKYREEWEKKNPTYRSEWYRTKGDQARAKTRPWSRAHPEKSRRDCHKRRTRLNGGDYEKFSDLEI